MEKQPQSHAGVPPVAPADNTVPGGDYGINLVEPNGHNQNQEVLDDATLNMDTYEGSGPRPSYLGLRGDRLIWGVTFFATMGFSLFGYDQGLMSGIISSPQFNGEFPETASAGADDVHAGTIRGTVTAVYEAGAFGGAVLSFFIGNRLGRLKMMWIGAIWMIVGTIIACLSFGPQWGFGQFIIARVISGVGTGMLTATIPSWVAECSKAHNRGFLICSEASTVAVGTVIAYWINYGCSQVNSSFSWRFPIALQAFFSFFVIWGALVMPQSPRWLLSNGHMDEGLKVIAALAGTSIDHPRALQQRAYIMDSINATRQAKASAKDMLLGGKKQNLRRMVIGASSQVHQQLGGCNAVIYYATILFEEQIELDRELSLILGGVLAIIYALFALLSFVIVERAGRRPLFLIGTAGQAVAMYITWACLIAGGKPAAKGAAFGLYLFIAFFGATLLPLPWLYPAELNAQSVRTQANAVSTMCNWLFNFLVVQVLPTMTASIGGWTFFLFAIENTIAFPLIWLFYPETGGRELTEIDLIFARAHLANRRPTLIAEEMPQLTAHQQEVMLEKYDINGPDDAEAGAVTRENVDLDIPPAEGDHKVGSYDNTRTNSDDDSNTVNEKPARI